MLSDKKIGVLGEVGVLDRDDLWKKPKKKKEKRKKKKKRNRKG